MLYCLFVLSVSLFVCLFCLFVCLFVPKRAAVVLNSFSFISCVRVAEESWFSFATNAVARIQFLQWKAEWFYLLSYYISLYGGGGSCRELEL